MNKQNLKELIQECFLEVLEENKTAEKPIAKGEPKKSKGDAVAKPNPMEKAFDTLATGLTKKHGKVKGKEMLAKKVKSIDEDDTPNTLIPDDLVVDKIYTYNGKLTMGPNAGQEISGQLRFIKQINPDRFEFEVIHMDPDTSGHVQSSTPGRRFITSKEGLKYLTDDLNHDLNEMGGPIPIVTVDIKYVGAPNNVTPEKIDSIIKKVTLSIQASLREVFTVPMSKVNVTFNKNQKSV